MVTGGNTLFEGLPQMLYKKLKKVSTDLKQKKRRRRGGGSFSVSSAQSTDANCHMCAVRCALPGQIGKARASTLKIVASKDRQISAWVGGAFCCRLVSHWAPAATNPSAMRRADACACVCLCGVRLLDTSWTHTQARCWRLCRPGKKSLSRTKTTTKKAQRWCRSSTFSLCLECCLMQTL
eukprot:COSAG02_NODE_14259_length_1292_cov_1.300084_2_plen_180_part_00